MKIIVIDNYDSFVFNLVHILHELNVEEVRVVKNDEVSLEELEKYDKILLSPGPGIPRDAGLMFNIIEKYHTSKSILGVCLGHQALGEFFGFELKQLSEPLHGISSIIKPIKDTLLFKNMPEAFQIGHYHSWIIAEKDNDHVKIVARDRDGNIMAIEHKEYKIFGVQFHPESILTEQGKTIIKNWINA